MPDVTREAVLIDALDQYTTNLAEKIEIYGGDADEHARLYVAELMLDELNAKRASA